LKRVDSKRCPDDRTGTEPETDWRRQRLLSCSACGVDWVWQNTWLRRVRSVGPRGRRELRRSLRFVFVRRVEPRLGHVVSVLSGRGCRRAETVDERAKGLRDRLISTVRRQGSSTGSLTGSSLLFAHVVEHVRGGAAGTGRRLDRAPVNATPGGRRAAQLAAIPAGRDPRSPGREATGGERPSGWQATVRLASGRRGYGGRSKRD
jgi:hypothetical protein